MNKKDYNKIYKEMEKAILGLIERNDIEYEVEEPKFDFSTKRFELKGIPTIGNMHISIEPFSSAKGYKKRGVHSLCVYMRFDTYRNEHRVFDGERLNEFSGKYNIMLPVEMEGTFKCMFMRDLCRIEKFCNGEIK